MLSFPFLFREESLGRTKIGQGMSGRCHVVRKRSGSWRQKTRASVQPGCTESLWSHPRWNQTVELATRRVHTFVTTRNVEERESSHQSARPSRGTARARLCFLTDKVFSLRGSTNDALPVQRPRMLGQHVNHRQAFLVGATVYPPSFFFSK